MQCFESAGLAVVGAVLYEQREADDEYGNDAYASATLTDSAVCFAG